MLENIAGDHRAGHAHRPLEPYPINPFRWHAILETPTSTRPRKSTRAQARLTATRRPTCCTSPTDTPAIEAAKRTLLGQVYLDWGTWAVVRDLGQEPIAGRGPAAPAAGNAPGRRSSSPTCALPMRSRARRRARPPSGLSGWVYIIDNRRGRRGSDGRPGAEIDGAGRAGPAAAATRAAPRFTSRKRLFARLRLRRRAGTGLRSGQAVSIPKPGPSRCARGPVFRSGSGRSPPARPPRDDG